LASDEFVKDISRNLKNLIKEKSNNWEKKSQKEIKYFATLEKDLPIKDNIIYAEFKKSQIKELK
jgi:hypothetical protein